MRLTDDASRVLVPHVKGNHRAEGLEQKRYSGRGLVATAGKEEGSRPVCYKIGWRRTRCSGPTCARARVCVVTGGPGWDLKHPRTENASVLDGAAPVAGRQARNRLWFSSKGIRTYTQTITGSRTNITAPRLKIFSAKGWLEACANPTGEELDGRTVPQCPPHWDAAPRSLVRVRALASKKVLCLALT